MSSEAQNTQFRGLAHALVTGEASLSDVRQAFPTAQLWVACEQSGALAPLATGDGLSWVAMFTAELPLDSMMHEGVRALRTTGGDILAMLETQPVGWGIVVDPGTPHQLVIEPDDVAAWRLPIATSSSTNDSPQPGQIGGMIVGTPTEPMLPATVARAAQVAQADPALVDVWPALWMIPMTHDAPALVLVVRCSPTADYDMRVNALNRLHAAVNADHAGKDPRRIDVADLDAFPGTFDHLIGGPSLTELPPEQYPYAA